MLEVQEEENITLLTSMMGDVDPDVVRRVLRKHNGDVQKAASSLLEGDTAEPSTSDAQDWSWGLLTGPMENTSGPRTPPPSKPVRDDPPVIDLTSDDGDKDLNAALAASLETSSASVPHFGPSNRAPDPSWAVVPSNLEQPSGLSQDDHSLSRAIQESLSTSYDLAQEPDEHIPLEQCMREDGRPVSLRPTQVSAVYVALVLQTLYFVPQVRAAVAAWRPTGYDGTRASLPTSGEEFQMWTILEMFAHMDVAVLNHFNIDDALRAFDIEVNTYNTDGPGERSFQLYQKLTLIIETVLYKDVATQTHDWPRLFFFRYGPAEADPSYGPFDLRIDSPLVRVDVQEDDAEQQDLVSSLSKQLVVTHPQAIFEPSQVVTFHLVRHEAPPSYSSGTAPPKSKHPFRYPNHIYLDQFMKENAALAEEKRRQQRDIHEEIQRLEHRSISLKRRNSLDTLQDLRSALHYYENIANRDDPERKTKVELMAMNLRKTLVRIENEIETIETQISALKTRLSSVFDGPELQKHRYDLRAVLIHDGLFGRSHLYSYVKEDGSWWKTLDYAVTEVSEDAVLNDAMGLHLGAGPYMLMYSRAIPENSSQPEPLQWPDSLKSSIQHNNRQFLSSLRPEVARNARYTSPTPSTLDSGWQTPLSDVEPATSPRIDPMDESV